ncbi:LOW QUALITY PROTEIN: hypothetical protein HID58_025128, partial [Brassica napus]
MKCDSTAPLFHSRTALKKLQDKLKMLKSELRRLNRESFGDLPARVKVALEVLCDKQNNAMRNHCTATFEEASDAWEHWHHLSGIEEQFLYQKSQVKWLDLGDRNTNFYHKTCQTRTSRNTIRRLITSDGRLADIKKEAVDYYEGFLQEPGHSGLEDITEVSYNEEITYWHFRVKINRICLFYSYGTKMEMTIYGGYEDRPKWVEIFWVDVHCAYPGVQATNSRFTLNSTRHTQVHIIDPLNNRLYMDFKNIHEIPHMNHMDRNCPIDVSNRSEKTCLIDIIRVVFNTKSHFDDLARPKMVFYIRDNICGGSRDFSSYFGLPELWLETDGRLSDFRFNPLLPEVEEFSQ